MKLRIIKQIRPETYKDVTEYLVQKKYFIFGWVVIEKFFTLEEGLEFIERYVKGIRHEIINIKTNSAQTVSKE